MSVGGHLVRNGPGGSWGGRKVLSPQQPSESCPFALAQVSWEWVCNPDQHHLLATWLITSKHSAPTQSCMTILVSQTLKKKRKWKDELPGSHSSPPQPFSCPSTGFSSCNRHLQDLYLLYTQPIAAESPLLLLKPLWFSSFALADHCLGVLWDLWCPKFLCPPLCSGLFLPTRTFGPYHPSRNENDSAAGLHFRVCNLKSFQREPKRILVCSWFQLIPGNREQRKLFLLLCFSCRRAAGRDGFGGKPKPCLYMFFRRYGMFCLYSWPAVRQHRSGSSVTSSSRS